MIPNEVSNSALSLSESDRLELARALVESVAAERLAAQFVEEGVRRIDGVAAGRIGGLTEEEASVEQKLDLIDELWESVRRAGAVEIPAEHLAELERRVAEVSRDPSIALSPEKARALLNK